MAKFVMECPACKKPIQAGTGLFAKKNIKCTCGYTINVQMEKMATDTCPHCGNDVVYDRTHKESATCPVCHTKIHAGTEKIKLQCPSCKIELTADKNAVNYTCPQCKSLIDIQAAVAKQASSGKTGVIKWDMGMNDIFVYRHPVENFNIGSQLIVNEGQKAIFFRNGKGLDTFGPGRHLLESQRLPLLSQMLDYPTDADLTWDSKVYFIRTNRLAVKWGIPELQLRNPGMDFYVKMGFSGSCDMQLIDNTESARQLLYMIIGASVDSDSGPRTVGGEEAYTTEYMRKLFKDVITTRLSDMMANIISGNGINILDIESKKNVISELIRKDMNQVFAEYGMEVPPMHFNVTNIRLQESEEVRQWMQQESDRVLKVREQDVLKAEVEATRGRLLAEDQTAIQRNILRAQGGAEELKIKTAAQGDAHRIAAMAEADVHKIGAQSTAETLKIKTAGEGDARRIAAVADADVRKLDAQTDAEVLVVGAQAQAEATKLGAQAKAESIRLTGQASADSYMAQAMAEAQEMHAKGYTYTQETSRQIGLEAMKDGLPGTKVSAGGGSGSNSMIGDMIGLGVGLSTMGEIVNMTKGMISPVMQSVTQSVSQSMNPPADHVPAAGAEPGWSCTCGKSGITSKFCPECGSPKPVPVVSNVWSCTCGKQGITSKFCPECGSKRPEVPGVWNCPNCGKMGITSNFCPECGSRKES